MTIKAHFDGKVFVPDEPVDLKMGEAFEIEVHPPRPRGCTGAEIAMRMKNSPLKKIWDDIAAGRDSLEVARDLRERASRRGTHP